MKYLILVVILLSSCRGTHEVSEIEVDWEEWFQERFSEIKYKFKNNTALECVYYSSGTQAGLSCNWEKYNKENK